MASRKRPKYRIRKDDMVVVTAGAEKGRTGRVIRILPRQGRVLVEGINYVQRHVRGTPEQPGRIDEREAPVHISNVALWDPEDERIVRCRWQRLEDGTRVRVDKRTGEQIDNP